MPTRRWAVFFVLTVALLAVALAPWQSLSQTVPGSFNIRAWLGSTAPTVGQKTMANSIPVVLPSDQAAIPVNSTPIGLTYSAQGTATVTTTAAALPANTAKWVCIRGRGTNTDKIARGTSGAVTFATGNQMDLGDALCGPFVNTNQIFFIANAGSQTVEFDVWN